MKVPCYFTWYEFKKELERRWHCGLESSVWLQVKPREPLPQSYSDLRWSYLKLLDLEKRIYLSQLADLSLPHKQETSVSGYRSRRWKAVNALF